MANRKMSTRAQVSLVQVLDFDEEEFARFIASNRDDHGTFIADHITDCHKAPLSLKQKLWARLSVASPADTATSHINLDDLNARLQVVSDAASTPTVLERRFGIQTDRRQTLTPPPSFTPPPATREDEENRGYYELIRLGGRPVCSLADFQKAYHAPQQHARDLIPWLDVLDVENLHSEDIKAFTTQLKKWMHFQDWQLESRGLSRTMHGSNSDGFQHFLDEKRRGFRAMGEQRIADGPNFEASMRTRWQQRQDVLSHTGARKQAANTHKGTRESMAVTKRRLKAARFNSRRPFKFHDNPKEQDERTTWIEYLRFECWWQDTRGDGTSQPREADEKGAPDREVGQPSVTGLEDSKTGRPRPRKGKPTDTRAELHTSFAAVQQSRDEAKGSETMPAAQLPWQSRQPTRNEELELQQRRLQWIVAQLASIEVNFQVPLGPKSTAKRKRGDGEDLIEDEDADQAEGSLRKKRTISGSKTRRQAPGSRSKNVKVKAGSRGKAAPERQKQSSMTLGLICPVQETRTTSDDGHRRSVRLQR